MSFDDGVRRSSADGTAGTAGFPRGSAAGRLAGGGSVRLAAAALVRGDGAAAAEPRPESDDEVVSCMLRSLSTNDGGRSTNSDRRAGTVPLLRKPRLNMDCRLLVEARTAVAVAPPGIHGAPEARPRCTARNLVPGKNTLARLSRRQTSSTVSVNESHKTKKTNTCRINVIHVHVPYAVWSVESVSQSVTPHRPPAPHS